MEPAVVVLLAGALSASLQHGRLLRRVIYAWLKSEREARPLAEASPQQAESLAAAVRTGSSEFITYLCTAKNGPPTEGPFFITGLSLIKARWKHRGKRYRDVSQQ